MLRYLYTLLVVAAAIQVAAQDTLVPDDPSLAVVHSFDRKAVGGGLMTTDLGVWRGDYVLAANQSGLLAFDGGSWDLIPMPNRGVARSVLATDAGIWVGGQGFIGRADGVVDPRWEDFSEQVREQVGDFGDVWHVEPAAADGVFVGGVDFIGLFSGSGSFKPLLVGPIVNSFKVGDGFGCQRGDSLHAFSAAGEPAGTWRLPFGVRVQAWIDAPEPLLLTHAQGVMALKGTDWVRLPGELSVRLIAARANLAVKAEAGWLIGTAEAGVFVTRDWQTLDAVYSRRSGLQGSSVLGLHVDELGNAWVAAEGALSIIRFSWPQRVPAGTDAMGAPGYSSLHVASGRRYWGTSLGLKTQRDALAPLEDVEGVTDQIWSLQSVNGRPWVSHLTGGGWVDGRAYTPVITGTGVWELVEQPTTGIHYAGTFQGLMRFDARSDTPPQPVAGFSETARFVVFESERIVWVAYPYKGVYRVVLDASGTRAESVQLYGAPEGFPDPVHVEVFDAAGVPIFSTNDGFYRYDAPTDRIVPAPDAFAGLIPRMGHVERLYAGEHATWWFLQGQSAGQIHPRTAALKTTMEVRRVPLSGTPMVAPFERLELLGNDLVCVPVEQGFLYLDAKRMDADAVPPALTVHSVHHLNHGDGARSLAVEGTELEAGSHALEIRLRGLDSRWVGVQRYQWRLGGSEADWSRPQESARITLGGLGPGTHRIEFRAIIEDGFVGPVTNWVVRVARPWHERWDVRIALLVLGVAGAAGLVARKQRRIRAEHAEASAEAEAARLRTEERYRREIESSELKLEAERLRRVESEMAAKNQELASATMHLVQKAQMTATLQAGLQSLRDQVPVAERKQVDRLLSVLGASNRLDDNWDQFTQQFDRVHVEFHQRLLDRFPDLTKNDLKLCTYLRMNLSSKEIASLTFVTVRAVEVSRSRLRKRLGLDPADNLLQFIQGL